MNTFQSSAVLNKIFIVILIICSTGAYAQQNLTITPANPSAGQSFRITYSPGGNLMNRKEAPQAVAYISSSNSRKATDLVLVKTGDQYSTMVQTDSADNFVQLDFFMGNEFDNNFNDGYTVLLHQGAKPKKGAYINHAQLYYFQAEQSGLERNEQKALDALENEFSLYPEQKKRYAGLYYRLFRALKPNDVLPAIEKDVEAAMKDGLTSEEDYDYVISLFDAGRLTQQTSFFEKLRNEKFPNGQWVMHNQVDQFMNEEDVSKKEAMLNSLIHNVDTDKNWVGFKNAVSHFKSSLLLLYVENKMWEPYRKMVNTIPDKNLIAANHNNVAWILQEKNEELALADEFATFAINQSRNEMKKPTGKKPDYLSMKQWDKHRADTYCMYADTWAMVKFRRGEYKKGFDVAKDVAIVRKKGEDSELNKTYVVLADKVLSPQLLKPELEKMVKADKAPSEATDILRRIYLSEKKTGSEFDEYISQLSAEVIEKKTADIKKSLINEAAPKFTLTDAKGKPVRLEDYRGKIIVLDFWATWCGPCISSFPGMQKVVDRYKDNPNVKVLFVNTWERGEDKEKKATDFIAKKDYSFELLFDSDNSTAALFNVDGIPSKFVIDGQGNIRFKSVGYSGSEAGVVTELTVMIETLVEKNN